MSIKVSKIENDYSSVDFDTLQEDLTLAEVENMDAATFAVAKYKTSGVRPSRIAIASAEQFGLKRAFWDVYSPVEGPTAGQWRLEKDASSGEEFIVRKDSTMNGEVK